jgi:nucleoside-diphosphate-sugar epimerase
MTERIDDVDRLEDLLSEPTPEVVRSLGRLSGDIMVLGAGGKMGPTLARMAGRALGAGPSRGRVIAVSRFSNQRERERLESQGVETVGCDLLDPQALEKLPEVPTVIYMVGMKFGATGNEARTWAVNAYLPAMVCRRFSRSRIVAFSTGNVYPMTPVAGNGSSEEDPPGPEGEYAMSCLGRERMFEYFSRSRGTRVSLLRLNYACELRYGVLVDLARKVWERQTIDLTMGHVNVIWQGDANAMALRAVEHCAAPPFVVNIAGPERLSVRRICHELGQLMNRPLNLVGEEAPDALLSDGSRGHERLGMPRVGIERLLGWIADWVMRGGPSLDKPTHFQVRDGRF